FLFLLGSIFTGMAQTQNDKTPSPPDVYQQFLIAMVSSDSNTVERLALTNQDLPMLTSRHLSWVPRKLAISHIKAHPYHVLKIGEVFHLPHGRVIGPTEQFEKNGWVLIANDDDPICHMLQKVGNEWKVDAGDLIAARKAVERKMKEKDGK